MNWVLEHMSDPGNICVYVWVCMYACTCMCVCVCICVCMHVYVCVYVCMYVCMYVWVCACKLCMYVCMCVFVLNIHVLIFRQSDFDTPFVPPGGEVSQGKTSSEGSVSEDGIALVMSLGFTREQAIKALRATVSGEIDGWTNC